MKNHVAENPLKSRRAVADGQLVVFYKRVKTAKGSMLRPWWKEKYQSHDGAVAAADAWASGGGVLQPGRLA